MTLIEHPDREPADPDLRLARSGNPRSDEALRSGSFLYVEYADGDKEYRRASRPIPTSCAIRLRRSRFAGNVTDKGLRFTWGPSTYTFFLAPDGGMWGQWNITTETQHFDRAITLSGIE